MAPRPRTEQPPPDTATVDVATARRAQLDTLMAAMATAVAADGGELRLVDVDVDEGVVRVELSGACSACAVSSVTLEAGVRRALMDRLDWVTDVIGTVDGTVDLEAAATYGQGGFVSKL